MTCCGRGLSSRHSSRTHSSNLWHGRQEMQWNPYPAFNGQCEAAFKFYERCLGGKVVAMIPFGETPHSEHVPPDDRGRIMHAHLLVGSQVLMGSDTPPGQPYEGVKGCSVTVQVDTPD